MTLQEFQNALVTLRTIDEATLAEAGLGRLDINEFMRDPYFVMACFPDYVTDRVWSITDDRIHQKRQQIKEQSFQGAVNQ